jgi:diguanylate cyclase (GGDEF)-like protein/PAS domain S-box-containing protein
MLASTHRKPRRYLPLKAALLYLAVGSLWIYFSDRLLLAWAGEELALGYQTWKGWLYVLITALLAYGLVCRLRALERARRQNAAEAGAMFENAALGMALLTPEGVWRRVNPALAQMLGFAPEEMLGRRHEAFAAPADAERCRAACSRLAAAEAPRLALEYQLLHRDGAAIPVRISLSLIQEPEAEAAAIVALFEDLRPQRELDAASRIASVAFQTHESLVVTDAEANILRVNRAFETLTGYTQAEVYGKNPRMLASGAHDAAFYAAMWASLREHGRWEGEVLNRARDGRVLPVWETITAVRDGDGKVTHYVAAQLDLRESKNAQQAIERLSRYDALTGLPNRQSFLAALEREGDIVAGTRYSALLFIDLDNFKQVNEAMGHEHGDRLLCEVARRLGGELDEDDELARHAADEFLLLYACRLEDRGSAAEAAARRAERLLAGLRHPFALDEREVLLSASIGVLLIDGSEARGEAMLRSADTAMHQAKRDGRDTVRFFDPSMQAHAENAYRVASELRQALAQDALELHYQPKVDLEGHTAGAEALLRWQRRDGTPVSPAVFVPIAEEAGLIGELGRWVLRRACRDLARLRRLGIDLPLAVNVSAAQVRQPDFVASVLDILSQAGAKPSDLVLEITESLVIEDVEAAIARLQELRGHGIRISMDDFGTGYSSLSHLKSLPLDEIKIDRAFVRDAERSPSDRALIAAIADIGRTLGLAVVAEGVESASEAALLRQAGCTGMQGYHFGRPAPLQALIERVRAADPRPLQSSLG